MKHTSPLLAFASLAVLPIAALADTLTVEIDGFADPTQFSITDSSGLSLRVAELVPATDLNSSTHILIEGLSPLEDGTMVYASPYSGINVDTGATQDVGILYLQMPEGSTLPEGTVASPIVGVVQRSGSWGDYGLTYPDSTIGGSSGDGDYSTTGVLQMTLIRDQQAFTGSATYTVLDVDTIEIDPFTLSSDGVVSYDLSGTTLMRDGSRYYGTLTNLSDGAVYDSLIFSIEFKNIPDLDSDGVPDIADDSVVAGLVPAQWNLTSIGWVYGYTANWGYSVFMGFVYMQGNYIYQIPFGWMYLFSSTPIQGGGTYYWFYSSTLGWIYVNDTFGGFFQAENNGWAYDNFLDPND